MLQLQGPNLRWIFPPTHATNAAARSGRFSLTHLPFSLARNRLFCKQGWEETFGKRCAQGCMFPPGVRGLRLGQIHDQMLLFSAASARRQITPIPFPCDLHFSALPKQFSANQNLPYSHLYASQAPACFRSPIPAQSGGDAPPNVGHVPHGSRESSPDEHSSVRLSSSALGVVCSEMGHVEGC